MRLFLSNVKAPFGTQGVGKEGTRRSHGTLCYLWKVRSMVSHDEIAPQAHRVTAAVKVAFEGLKSTVK